jgi:amino acid transporter
MYLSNLTNNDDKIFGMFGKDTPLWEEIKFISRQLGIIDTKAHNVITIDAVLIVISTLTSLFDEKIDYRITTISSIATIGILISVGFCIKTVWTKWATEFHSKDELKDFRNLKTKYLHCALITLLISLGLYIVALMFAIVDNFETQDNLAGETVVIQITQRKALQHTLINPGGNSGQSVAVCNLDEIVTGGGYLGGRGEDFYITHNKKRDDKSWLVIGRNNSTNSQNPVELTTFAECAKILT